MVLFHGIFLKAFFIEQRFKIFDFLINKYDYKRGKGDICHIDYFYYCYICDFD